MIGVGEDFRPTMDWPGGVAATHGSEALMSKKMRRQPHRPQHIRQRIHRTLLA